MANKTLDLGAALARLDESVKAGDRAVAASLRPGATAATIAKLEKTVGAMPQELRRWLAWHDGQKGTVSIGPSENDRLLSSKNVADAWKFLERDANGPWKAAWLPLTTNGAGDHLVYDRASGALVRYYHDEKMRPKEAPSLTKWVLEIASGWQAATKSKQPTGVPDGWSPATSPKVAAAKKVPPGTAYFFRATSNIGKGVFIHLFWKKESDAWFQATNTTFERAWTSISNNLFPFQATPDRGMEYCLGKDKVFVDGQDAPHAGLFTRHFGKPPFPAKKK